jgi:hypothetical protein
MQCRTLDGDGTVGGLGLLSSLPLQYAIIEPF